jgi:hypothetical protein
MTPKNIQSRSLIQTIVRVCITDMKPTTKLAL